MNKLNVLYEDNHIIVVEKEANILSQKDDTNDPDLLSLVKEYIKEKYNKSGEAYIGLVHRLDRPVSGVMVFARTSKAASRLSKQIQDGTFHKNYYAVVHGILDKKEDELIDKITKLNDNSSVIDKNGKLAKLKYKVIEENKELDLSLVDIDLETGRHHQIRVQFANISHPLYGDQRYGLQDKKQIALHSYKVSFVHPTTKEIMTFILPPKSNDIWKNFKSI